MAKSVFKYINFLLFVLIIYTGCASTSHLSSVKTTPRTFELPYELLFVKAIETGDELGWKLSVADEKSGLIKYETDMNLLTMGDIVTIGFSQITKGKIRVDVRSHTPNQVITWGRNTENTKNFYYNYDIAVKNADLTAFQHPVPNKQQEVPKEEKGNKESDGPSFKSSGTSFFISEDGLLITNNHVVRGGKSFYIVFDEKLHKANLLKKDGLNDLALLQVEGKFEYLPIKSSKFIKLGDDVFTIGFPNVGLQGIEPKFTKGNISSLAGIADDPRLFQISVQVQPGNSGGPLVDHFGNVVGVIVSKLDEIKALSITGSMPQNVNYAIKSTYLDAFLESVTNVTPKLKRANSKRKNSRTVIKEIQNATVMVLVE